MMYGTLMRETALSFRGSSTTSTTGTSSSGPRPLQRTKHAVQASANSRENNMPKMRSIEASDSLTSPALEKKLPAAVRPPGSYRVSLFDAMKVFGPAPERINCRLAMLMFLPMVAREMKTSETIFDQFAHPSFGYIILCALVVYGTMVPILKGAKDEDFGIMKVSAEKANGRIAMLAWAVLIGLEHWAGVCFF